MNCKRFQKKKNFKYKNIIYALLILKKKKNFNIQREWSFPDYYKIFN